ncbi:MAG: dihydrofolate reductase family protein [Solirubrobacterales bacterium]|nr:dihydrofolate reductase family protein [Solirubrobacterales bacterium]MBV9536486.1 dihydrofolate reductase family protein [Solirubrobacterales bacterium]
MAISFRQIFPEPKEVPLEAVPDSFASLGDRVAGRPYTVANFVSSLDGRATIGGRSAPLSGPSDRALFHTLRESVDAVIAGTNTLRVERYGRMIKDPAARERRAQRGLAPEPLAVVVSRTGQVPYEIPLFSEPEARIVEFTGADAPRPVAAQRELIRLRPEEVSLRGAMERLRTVHGVRTLLCEGGPTLFGALVAENLVDELYLTTTPLLVGGESNPAILAGPPLAEPAGLELSSVLERDGSLFLRFAFRS